MTTVKTKTEQKSRAQMEAEKAAMIKGAVIGAAGMFAFLAYIGTRERKLRSRHIDAEYKKLCDKARYEKDDI